MPKKELCNSCIKYGIEAEMFESENLSRCLRCIQPSFAELNPKDHFEKIKKEKENEERIALGY